MATQNTVTALFGRSKGKDRKTGLITDQGFKLSNPGSPIFFNTVKPQLDNISHLTRTRARLPHIRKRLRAHRHTNAHSPNAHLFSFLSFEVSRGCFNSKMAGRTFSNTRRRRI